MNISGKETVLDAGCGTGALLIVLKTLYPGVDAKGLDPDEPALNIARNKSAGKGLDISWLKSFMAEIPLEDGSVDYVVSTLAFHHVEESKKRASLGECLRVLKPGGRLTLLDMAPDDSTITGSLFFRALHHFEPFNTDDGLLALVEEAGFSDVKIVWRYRCAIKAVVGLK
jgi:ubiquinone/menaquinone biosynthesis C-methylase UbiE